MSMYKTPTEAKKLDLPLGAPARVQKRRPLCACFDNQAGPLPNPVFHPEIEPEKQKAFMEPQPFVKEKKDKVRKNWLRSMEEADLKAEGGMEAEAVYEDMATDGPSADSDVENQPIDPESWKDGDIVTGKASEAHEEVVETIIDGAPTSDTARRGSTPLSDVEPKEHDEEGAMGFAGDDDSESDEGTLEDEIRDSATALPGYQNKRKGAFSFEHVLVPPGANPASWLL
ncbi:rho GTPase-activating protein 22 [Platysternon megacephalum]|uniref:Rho GTPase-activating protein 22 n=1 Tax=Platysternon megacephalum TaxID=55544 RepID=A0A4D9E198_9SAUR|nr:rho GTPase-activating protein 22 [Platysternon megacephalum]